MSEINYKKLDAFLDKFQADTKNRPCVWLIFGEDLLCKTAFKNITNVLNPGDSKDINHEIIDNDNIYDALEKVNTYSMFAGNKLVSLMDSRIFYSGREDNKLVEKARQAYDSKQMKKAAKFVTALLSLKNLSYDDLNGKDLSKIFGTESEFIGDGKWLESVIEFCLDSKIKIKPIQDNLKDLEKAVEKGFPQGNYLIITAEIVDRRRTLYKTIKKKGVVVDCSVPKGTGRADKTAQNAILNEQVRSVLSKYGKNLDSMAFHALCEMTGFDLRTFKNNLEKLANYTGSRSTITIDDVKKVLKRTKKDPIYELTNAVSDRNLEASLFYINSLISDGLFPIQILSSIIKQMRTLLLVKGFTESPGAKTWNPMISYDRFQQIVMPAIKENDRHLIDKIESWNRVILNREISANAHNENSKPKTRKKAKTAPATDLIIAKNPRSAYPVFLALKKSGKYTMEKLVNIMEKLSKADIQLKTTGRDPRMVLEEAVIYICRNE